MNSGKALAHAALDDAIDYLRDVAQRPVWQPVPENVKDRLNEPLPILPQGLEPTYRDFRELILPYATGNIHPRFWGWVHGTGLPAGIISAMLGAAMNSNCGGRDHGALYVERRVMDWCRQIVGYPESVPRVLVSGTSMGSIIGLAVAPDTQPGTMYAPKVSQGVAENRWSPMLRVRRIVQSPERSNSSDLVITPYTKFRLTRISRSIRMHCSAPFERTGKQAASRSASWVVPEQSIPAQSIICRLLLISAGRSRFGFMLTARRCSVRPERLASSADSRHRTF